MGLDDEVLKARKVTTYLPITEEALMDAGAIPDTRPPYRAPWRFRVRHRIQDLRERIGERIAGRRFTDTDDW